MKEREFDNFDEFADDYRDTHNKSIKLSGVDSDYFSRYKIEELTRLVPAPNVKSILDFGCGDGNSVVYMRELFADSHITGIDVSQKSIDIASDRHLKNCSFEAFDGKKIQYKDNSFDIVFTSMVFHHIEHELHPNLMSEIRRVLKPKGKFVIFEHNPINPLTRKVVRECPFDTDAVLLAPKYTKELFRNSGLKNISLNFTIFFPRIFLLNYLVKLEPFLKKLSLGAQYYIIGEK